MTVSIASKKSDRPYRIAPARAVRGRSRVPRGFHFSTEQYSKLIDLGIFADRRVQLLEGELIEMPSIDPPHRTAIVKTEAVIRRTFPNHLVTSQLPLRILDSEPEPAVAVLAGSIDDYLDAHPSTAVMAIEIPQATRNAYQTRKLRIYASGDIAEYWILNLKARQLEVLTVPVAGVYTEKRVLGETDFVTPLAAPKTKIVVSDMLP